MGGLAKFLFGDDEEEPKKSGRAKKPGPGGGRKPLPKKSGRPGKTPRKTVAGGSGTPNTKPHTMGRKGSAMPVKTAAELERELKARKKSKGNVEDQALEYYKLWRRKKSDEDKAEVLELIQADKKAFKLLKPYLPQDMLDALEGVESGSGDTASGSSKLPKGMDKAAYQAAKAKAEQLKADGKTQGEIIFELATDNVHPDITDHVIKEVCG